MLIGLKGRSLLSSVVAMPSALVRGVLGAPGEKPTEGDSLVNSWVAFLIEHAEAEGEHTF